MGFGADDFGVSGVGFWGSIRVHVELTWKRVLEGIRRICV